MEPLLQVQAWKKKIKPKEAAELVEFINKKQKRNVKYWSVGNEPDHDRCTVCDIASMVKSFSSAMKAVDSSIIIFAPELAHYDTSLLNPLLTPGNINDITGKDERGNYYVDVISVHSYPFDGSQSRDEVINKMPEIESRLTTLNERIENCNTYHKRWKNNALKLGLTEVNIAYKNNWPTGLTGTSANSFLGGQFWAEFTGAAMKHEVYTLCFFSIMEGEDANTNIGYLDGSTGMPKPTYYHLSLIANHFKGIYCDGKSKIPGVKVFGSKSEDEVSVAILNETDKDCAYLLYLNSSPVPDKSALNIEAGLNSRLQGSIPANSTQVLVFKNNASIIRKYEYRMKGEAEHNLPPTISVLPLLETDYRH